MLISGLIVRRLSQSALRAPTYPIHNPVGRISLRIPPMCALSAERAILYVGIEAGVKLGVEMLAFHFRSPVNYRSFGFGGYALHT